MIPFLEHGSNVFLSFVTTLLGRFSLKEKTPFVRVLSIWEERRVFSPHFIERLRSQWDPSRSVSSPTASQSSSINQALSPAAPPTHRVEDRASSPTPPAANRSEPPAPKRQRTVENTDLRNLILQTRVTESIIDEFPNFEFPSKILNLNKIKLITTIYTELKDLENLKKSLE